MIVSQQSGKIKLFLGGAKKTVLCPTHKSTVLRVEGCESIPHPHFHCNRCTEFRCKLPGPEFAAAKDVVGDRALARARASIIERRLEMQDEIKQAMRAILSQSEKKECFFCAFGEGKTMSQKDMFFVLIPFENSLVPCCQVYVRHIHRLKPGSIVLGMRAPTGELSVDLDGLAQWLSLNEVEGI